MRSHSFVSLILTLGSAAPAYANRLDLAAMGYVTRVVFEPGTPARVRIHGVFSQLEKGGNGRPATYSAPAQGYFYLFCDKRWNGEWACQRDWDNLAAFDGKECTSFGDPGIRMRAPSAPPASPDPYRAAQTYPIFAHSDDTMTCVRVQAVAAAAGLHPVRSPTQEADDFARSASAKAAAANLGSPVQPPKRSEREGWYRDFERGSVFASRFGTFAVAGKIRDEWGRKGWEAAADGLGFPASHELACADAERDRYQQFERGFIHAAQGTIHVYREPTFFGRKGVCQDKAPAPAELEGELNQLRCREKNHSQECDRLLDIFKHLQEERRRRIEEEVRREVERRR
jgi:hypothetical protein